MKKLVLAVFFVIAVFVSHWRAGIAQQVEIESKIIEYNLLYPGILPDHPFYFLKQARDTIVYFLTRDYIKKAKLKLEFSDKKANMALLLSQKGKWKLAATTLLEAEVDFNKISGLISTSKKQGVTAPDNFILTLKLSNEKHQQVIEELLKNAPQGERSNFEKALYENQRIRKTISKL